MANISIRVDDALKKQIESICEELGMSLSTATNLFYKKMISYGGIPFELKVDPFYSRENQEHLKKVISNYENDKSAVVTKTLDELESMEE
ncbi:MAG: type II toxin-antitoxin system RelB/DinJ family antitoxin [Eubacteriales bacterium]|nr:type II toxin-antitoxin system RelB/DinJ family antitoxin [Eubacteriales bacterium]